MKKGPTGRGPWAWWKVEALLRLLFRGGFAHFFARLVHFFFEVFAGAVPSRFHQRNAATAFGFAVVLSGIFAAASLAFAVVLPRAAMVPGFRGALALPRAVILAGGALAFAGIQAAAGVRLS